MKRSLRYSLYSQATGNVVGEKLHLHIKKKWLKEQIRGDRFERYFERNQQLVPNCGRGERKAGEGERLKVT